MSQFALPLPTGSAGPDRIVVGAGNHRVSEALASPESWPFKTAIITGPARSGKSLFASWFKQSGRGDVVDDAFLIPEDDLFHRWNRAQEEGAALLIIGGVAPWNITLPDLRSRLGAALQLEIMAPDDEMAADLLLSFAQERGLALGGDGAEYLVARAGRSYKELERIVMMVDRLSLERKAPPTQGIWRAALEAVHGPDEPRLL